MEGSKVNQRKIVTTEAETDATNSKRLVLDIRQLCYLHVVLRVTDYSPRTKTEE